MINWDGRITPFPADLAERYRSAGLWGSSSIGEEFHRVARRDPARCAVVAEEGSLTYGELDELTDRLGAGLAGLGLLPGDRVMVQLTNRLQSVVAWYGLLKAGLIPVCTLAAHRAHEIGAISRKVGAVAHLVESAPTPSSFDLISFAIDIRRDHPTLRHILTAGASEDSPGVRIEQLIADTDAALARDRVAEIQKIIDPDEVVAFQLSGGTTGIPKLIPRLHAEYWYNAFAFAHASGWSEQTRAAHLIPIIHNAGISCALHAVHSVGGTLILATAVLDQALALMARERATDALIGHGHFSVVDHERFAEGMTSMRRVLLSGAKVPPRVFEAFERQGVWAGQTFGMGEGLFTMSTPTATTENRLQTVGVPISSLDEFRVLEPGTESEVEDGAVGEFVCRGPYTIHGYFDAPEINAASFTSDGFYRTGDLVAVRQLGGERGIAIEGRLKDLINRGGEKISAEEVEGLLLRHSGIVGAALVAMPDERLGERACAYLVAAREPLTLDDVRMHLDALSVAKFKWPERLEWVSSLPMTPVGKVDKKQLRARAAEATLTAR
ncbi:(2,3-dihydroxybenzoyl)adenylate synthase [Herbiconiux sp. UC225_62]|uniref:(2,3-dihydroxybenzoyl)adenylate synthase n=1 Tax=Herbiconiux sp. UC225_62 TaxID=3350168 RepID=UPI0036D27BFE